MFSFTFALIKIRNLVPSVYSVNINMDMYCFLKFKHNLNFKIFNYPFVINLNVN